MSVVAVWLSPVVLAALCARVVAGDVGVPAVVATVAAAPLVALLRPPAGGGGPESGLADVAVIIALTCALAANLAVIGDLVHVLDLERLHGVVGAAGIALLVVATPAADRGWRLAVPVGTVAVLVPLVLVALSAGAPWTTWAAHASRPALTFDARSAWVTEGGIVAERVTVKFDEPHRVVAASPATWRVVERDATRVAVREWRLATGDALTLRPGDHLALDAGARVRFESGRRIPGAPASGVAWADARPRSALETLVGAMGVAVALVGGALAVAPTAVRPSRTAALGASMLLVAFVVGATVWGVYGSALAPDLALTPRALPPLAEITTRIAADAWRQAVLGVVVSAVFVLLVGVALAARVRFGEVLRGVAVAAGHPAPSAAAVAVGAVAVVAVAAALATRTGDAWPLFVWGLGLATTAAVAPRLADAGPRGEIAGAIVGAAAFGAIVALGGRLPVALTAVAEQPALVAAPIAWMAARLARGSGGPES